ncbi:hypothetical protein RRG08_042768 [Elysia crispata]|uniref:Uncharacterized protein n=1 Tax=Elysia crispata TaxID=231223 RepID=A0AAE0XRL6_9GAST|nr:hypothetical protein RRG08_042768 [Elysia crispata]
MNERERETGRSLAPGVSDVVPKLVPTVPSKLIKNSPPSGGVLTAGLPSCPSAVALLRKPRLVIGHYGCLRPASTMLSEG